MRLSVTMLRMSLTNLLKLPKEDIVGFINSFDTVLTDCDGVLWLGSEPIEGSAEVMNRFREMGKKVFFVTNNSTKAQPDYLEKFRKLKFVANKEDVIGTAFVAARYLKSRGFNKKVYVIGAKGLCKELDNVGIKHNEPGPDAIQTSLVDAIANFKKDPEVGAVIVGLDHHFSYLKMLKAASYLKNPDVLFIATNTDEVFPHRDENLLVPGSGSLVMAVRTVAGRDPIVMGKPHSFIADILKEDYKVDPKRTLMIGDRCNTDILFGTRCGYQTLLVLTGTTSLKEVSAWKESPKKEEQELVPDFYVDKLGDLLPYLK